MSGRGLTTYTKWANTGRILLLKHTPTIVCARECLSIHFTFKHLPGTVSFSFRFCSSIIWSDNYLKTRKCKISGLIPFYAWNKLWNHEFCCWHHSSFSCRCISPTIFYSESMMYNTNSLFVYPCKSGPHSRYVPIRISFLECFHNLWIQKFDTIQLIA